MPEVQFKKSPLYSSTLAKYARNERVINRLKAFLEHKKNDVVQPFGNKDRPFSNEGNLSGYKHAGLTYDIQIIYTQSGSNPTIIKLYMIATHDEIGTGTPPNYKKQKQVKKKLDRQPFESKRIFSN